MNGKSAWGKAACHAALGSEPIVVPRPAPGQIVATAAAAANSGADGGNDPWVRSGNTPPTPKRQAGDPWTVDLRDAPWRGTASWKAEPAPGKGRGNNNKGKKAKGKDKGSNRSDGYVEGRGYTDWRSAPSSGPPAQPTIEWHGRSSAARAERGKGQWPQQQANVAWVAGADTRHDPDA